jgi:hypothetical protein
MNIKINMSMIVTGLITMLIGYFILQLVTKQTVNGVPVKSSFLGFDGHSGALVDAFSGEA